MLLHIHGFNSSPASNTFHMLRAVFPEARALAYACHGLFADNLAALREQAVALYQEALDMRGLAGQELMGQGLAGQGLREQHVARESAASAKDGGKAALTPLPALVISGSSLGGFYASQLAARLHAEYPQIPCHCALFNPVVYPATALRPFLGRNTLMHSGEEWEFTPAMLESYAHFPDTRTGADVGTGMNTGTGSGAGADAEMGRCKHSNDNSHSSCHANSMTTDDRYDDKQDDRQNDKRADRTTDSHDSSHTGHAQTPAHTQGDHRPAPIGDSPCATTLERRTATVPLRRFVLLGRNDSLLNPAEARAYWHGHALIHDTNDEHSIATLDAVTVAALRDLGAGA